MHGLSPADLDVQARARAFADELIPFEVEAEMNDGALDAEVAAKHRARALELGLYATNIPVADGGRGLSMLQQVLVQEQGGRVTNALAWVLATPPSWLPAVLTEHQRQRWFAPTVRGEMQECYAITEENAGSAVSASAATAPSSPPASTA